MQESGQIWCHSYICAKSCQMLTCRRSHGRQRLWGPCCSHLLHWQRRRGDRHSLLHACRLDRLGLRLHRRLHSLQVIQFFTRRWSCLHRGLRRLWLPQTPGRGELGGGRWVRGAGRRGHERRDRSPSAAPRGAYAVCLVCDGIRTRGQHGSRLGRRARECSRRPGEPGLSAFLALCRVPVICPVI